MKKSGNVGFISMLPSFENPVYTITGKDGKKWSALPNQFTYAPFVPPPISKEADAVSPVLPPPPKAEPKTFSWMDSVDWGQSTKEFGEKVVLGQPEDINGNALYDTNRVWIWPIQRAGTVSDADPKKQHSETVCILMSEPLGHRSLEH